MPESPYPELPVDDALALVLAALRPLAEHPVALADSLGLVLAEPVVADSDMPPFASSAKDGFAVIAADGSGERVIAGEAVAGAAPGFTLASGQAGRIATGAPLPAGADAVVMVESTTTVGDRVVIESQVETGADVRLAGVDYRRLETVVPAGTRLGPADIGLAASAGARLVVAYRRPRVVVLSTGDELVPPGAPLGPGQIRDSNRYALLAAVTEAGGLAVDGGHIADAADAVAGLAMAVDAADVVVTSGGVSMGRRDLVKPWLAQAGRVVFGRVRTKPGKPMTFALVNGTPVFALPGFPVSALVSFELFVRPALLRLAGHTDVARPMWSVRAGHDIRHAQERTEFQRAQVVMTAEGPEATVTGAQGSGRLLSLAHANALVRLPEGTGFTRAGEAVSALITAPVNSR